MIEALLWALVLGAMVPLFILSFIGTLILIVVIIDRITG
jgi:hypothetical protein